MKLPRLILPGWAQRPPPRVASREFGLFVPPEALFPDLDPTEATLAALLGTLSRDAVLFACAHLNSIVSGTGHPDQKPRQERTIGKICTDGDLRRINAFTAAHPGSGLPTVFFRGLNADAQAATLTYSRRPCHSRRVLNVAKALTNIPNESETCSGDL